jgi:surface antigen
MERRVFTCVVAATLGLAGLGMTGAARASAIDYDTIGDEAERLPGYLQCVPYARQVSGIQIRGDAWTWWNQADGHYARGNVPRVGAVMAFRPYGRMQLGHVAAVSRVIDSRTVLLRHANWSPINGRRGQVEDDVIAVDSSPNNDWSEVRVWFDPIKGLGSTRWPLAGFIYNKKGGAGPVAKHLLPVAGSGSDPIGEIIAAFAR